MPKKEVCMGRHKLPYKLKKPNNHHKYWRYVLSTSDNQSEISTKTRVKYEAERIAKEAYKEALEQQMSVTTFGNYAADFFTSKCKLTLRKKSSNKTFSDDMLKVKRGQLTNYLLPKFKDVPLDEITPVMFEDWRLTLNLANSTKNGITIVMKQILNEAVRDKKINLNPLQQVETLAKIADNPRDSLSVEDMKKLFPLNEQKALKVWRSQKYHTLMFLLVSSGMRSGEVRALKWSDVLWEDSGLLITKAVKNSGAVGTVKEKKEKFVRIPGRTIELLKAWKTESLATGDEDLIFYGKETTKSIDRGTILDNFKKGLDRAKIKGGKNLVPHSLRHTFNSYMLTVLPSEVVRKFTGHSSEEMSKHYYHPLLRQELKETEQFQEKIDRIWG
jgi:integrase